MQNEEKLNTGFVAEGMTFEHATGKLDYTLTNDYLFHVVMQNNEKVLRGLIGSLLGLKQSEIIEVELKNPIKIGEAMGDKDVILDLRIVLNKNCMLNIEMQVENRMYWVERSLTYICKSFDNLKSGEDYGDVMPCLHIGIIDFELFEDQNRFYSKYRLMDTDNYHIYTTKFGINVLNLKHIDCATESDIEYELDVWARLFKAGTWEELKAMAEQYDFAREAATSIYAVSADEAIKLQCEARERYERDWAGSFRSGKREGIKQGIEMEQANTRRESERADKAEAEVEKLKTRIGQLENALKGN